MNSLSIEGIVTISGLHLADLLYAGDRGRNFFVQKFKDIYLNCQNYNLLNSTRCLNKFYKKLKEIIIQIRNYLKAYLSYLFT